ncbi:MAG: 50S ribosomal protein L24 [Candidatus Latescibacteria bacterium]|jgi:large subunit ribosomal protein L24|nr:50S ribosomal protein L24 [Candidatus Latescibacterota bacterium]
MHIRKGDTVEVISGIHAGERGKVLKVFPQQGRALVEGVNFIKRHTRPSPKNQQGGIIEKEAPVPSSKLMLVDPQTEERTRVRRKQLEDGTRIRIAAKSGEQIPDAS